MILDIGIDIVENERINESNLEYFIDKILTKEEKSICLSKNGKKKLEFLCGRFAAKEAIIKAISSYENPHMKEIEILNNTSGKPYVIFKDYSILISISHEKHYTVAEAIYIKEQKES